MTPSSFVRRLPLLAASLVACGDDTAPASGTTTESSTSDTPTSSPTLTDDTATTQPSTTAQTASGDTTTSADTTSTESETTTSEPTTTAGNQPPAAVDDTYYAFQEIPMFVDATAGLSANDVDPDSDELTVTAFDMLSANGNIVFIASDGSVSFIGMPGYWGRDSFGYTVEDSSGLASSATVTVFVAPIDIALGDVDNSARGFVIDGEAAYHESGNSVGSAGDVNGDGLADVIIGAVRVDDRSGRSYVVFGKADGSAVDLANLGAGGFTIVAGAEEWAGYSVSGAGDINGDGLDDVIVGAPSHLSNPDNFGHAYVVFGKADTTEVDLTTLGAGGFAIAGEAYGDQAAGSVSGAGDINADGMDDVVVGAWGHNGAAPNAGRSYVVFGKADTAEVELSMLGAGGFVIEGETQGGVVGIAVSGAGDINADGMDDVVVRGHVDAETYVVFGKADAAAVDVAMLGAGGFVIEDHSISAVGRSVDGVGDVDGDGLDDLVIAAVNTARAYVVFGKADTAAVDLAQLDDGGFVINGTPPELGLQRINVSGVGDVDGDGTNDMVLGFSDPFVGTSYVVYGKADTAAVDLSMLGTGGFGLRGEVPEDQAGYSVSGLGDVDGDGVDDLVIAARWADASAVDAGRSYVVFGVPTGEN